MILVVTDHDLMVTDHDLVVRDNGLVVRDHDLVVRDHGLVVRDHDLVVRFHDLMVRDHDLVVRDPDLMVRNHGPGTGMSSMAMQIPDLGHAGHRHVQVLYTPWTCRLKQRPEGCPDIPDGSRRGQSQRSH